MLRQTKDLQDLAIVNLKDLDFDDEVREICYLVVETGSRLSCRKVLILPIFTGKPDWMSGCCLTRRPVNKPGIALKLAPTC